MTAALLLAALSMGFLGSPHCLGMCGGLVTAFGLSMKDTSPNKRRALVATYHFGRLTSYAFLGLLAGFIGTTALAPFMTDNQLPRILLGLVLLFVGMTMLGAPFLAKLEKLGMRFWQWLSPLRQKVFPLTTFPRALAAGRPAARGAARDARAHQHLWAGPGGTRTAPVHPRALPRDER